jgi:Thin aggregative fimbriae synthesis protein
MIAIPDIDVSFDISSANGATRVIPYVVAAHDTSLHYDLKVLKSGATGRSNISQSGTLALRAGESRAVSSLALTPQKGDQCSVTVTLTQAGQAVRTFAADCSVQ